MFGHLTVVILNEKWFVSYVGKSEIQNCNFIEKKKTLWKEQIARLLPCLWHGLLGIIIVEIQEGKMSNSFIFLVLKSTTSRHLDLGNYNFACL